jgi:hypothetical protein
VELLVTLPSGAELHVTEAQLGRGPEALIEGKIAGAGEVRFPKSEAVRAQLAERGRPIGRRGRSEPARPPRARRRET